MKTRHRSRHNNEITQGEPLGLRDENACRLQYVTSDSKKRAAKYENRDQQFQEKPFPTITQDRPNKEARYQAAWRDVVGVRRERGRKMSQEATCRTKQSRMP